jgi:hemoglobin
MKQDIETRKDIDALLNEFYKRAFADDRIGYIFTDVVKLDLEKHLPVIGDFWESMLLGNNVYRRHGRNPLQIHAEINEKTSLEVKHFRRWLEIFHTTVDEMFAGEKADFAKSRAEAVANRMRNFIADVPDISAMNRETLVKIQANRE